MNSFPDFFNLWFYLHQFLRYKGYAFTPKYEILISTDERMREDINNKNNECSQRKRNAKVLIV